MLKREAPSWVVSIQADVVSRAEKESAALEVLRRNRLRLGIIGLGRLWEARHKPALMRMADRFQVVAVYDQVAKRAAMEATTLRCVASSGIQALVDRPDVDAISILGPQWFGLHALEIAAKSGKPIYCAVPSISDPEGLTRALAYIRSHGSPFMPEFARRFYPATLRLRELLATTLGAPRLILGHSRLFGFDRYATPGPTIQLAPLSLAIDPGSFLLDWSRFIFQANPASVRGTRGSIMAKTPADPSDADYLSFTLEFAGGGLAQMGISRYDRGAWGDATKFLPQPGFQVFAERGVAWLEMPDRVVWSDATGTHEERLPMEPTIGELLNDHFLRMVRGEPSFAPTIDDAIAAIHLHRGLQASLEAGHVSPLTKG